VTIDEEWVIKAPERGSMECASFLSKGLWRDLWVWDWKTTQHGNLSTTRLGVKWSREMESKVHQDRTFHTNSPKEEVRGLGDRLH